MKLVKNYDSFSEDYKLNENLFGQVWGAIANYFKRYFGMHAWIYYALYLQKKGQLPAHQFELICPPAYLNKNELPQDNEISQELKDRFEKEYSKKDENEDEEDVAADAANTELKEGLSADSSDYITLSHADPEMEDVNVKQLKDIIIQVYQMNALRAKKHGEEKYSPKSQYVRKKTHAVFIWGAPGIGKTEILHQVAKELEVAVEEWHLATIEPTDFRGVPKVENIMNSNDPKDERSVSKLPALFPTSDGKNGKGGIMFFDELNRAPEMVLGASLSLALSGRHGQYELPPHWIVIAAGNRPDDIPGRLIDDKILWNRFHHLNYKPEVEEWAEYSKTLPYMNPDLIEFLSKKDKSGRNIYGEYYHQLSPEKPNPNWPSPRTWEMASEEEYFERGEDWNNRLSRDEIKDIYEDLVGYKAASAFADFAEQQETKRAKEREERRRKEAEERAKNPKKEEAKPKDDVKPNEEKPVTKGREERRRKEAEERAKNPKKEEAKPKDDVKPNEEKPVTKGRGRGRTK